MSRFPEIKPAEFSAAAVERDMLGWWDAEGIFERCTALRADAPRFTFYEGPPTANGRPGVHHVMARTIKDTFCRYKVMRGFRVDRKGGWDTHGLPVEIEVEKELGLKNRAEIEAYGIDRYNEACKASVGRYTALWNDLTRRIGYWVDLETPYVTYHNDYIESVWWLLRQFWDKELLYRGHKIHWYSPGTGTVLSSHEVSLGYKEVDDPSVTVRFAAEGAENTYFLAWTTTPWTLISNLLLAVGPELDYVTVRCGDEKLILAEARLEVLDGDHEILERHKGRDLVGRRYHPVFEHFRGEPGAFRVVAADYVTTEDGTGIVHTAPAFGADDFATAGREGVELVNPVGRDGCFEADLALVGGLWFKDADKVICRDLKERGLLYRREQYRHNYPHDWRKGTPLMSYPVESWFIRTTAIKDRLVELNGTINWQPGHVGKGRFGEWLQNNVDWALSRHRFWGTPLPIWVSDHDPEYFEVIGSVEELRQKCGADWPGDEALDLHRPFVDRLTWTCPKGGTMRRVPEIIDVWFDSGAMPFAQWHYPFENRELFEQNFPADFIAEGLDQTRGWFYTLVVLATALFDEIPFKNCVVNGMILAEDGRKMSKSLKNYPDPDVIFDGAGADALRAYLINSPVLRAEPLRFSEEGVRDVVRTVLLPYWNAFSFFTTYAEADGITRADLAAAPPVSDRSELDRWIVSVLQSLVREVNVEMEHYRLYAVVPPILGFIDDLTNWYIRRSRRRFWAQRNGADDADKLAAFATLYEVLITFSQVAAPVLPFITEEIYQALVRDVDKNAAASVHHTTYPVADSTVIDAPLEAAMDVVRRVVNLGRGLRKREQVRVRQPLRSLRVVSRDQEAREAVTAHVDLISDELNVKEVAVAAAEQDLVHLSAKANFKTLGPRHGPRMKEIAGAIAALDHDAVAALLDGKPLQIGGETIDSGDVIVDREPRAGIVVAAEGELTVVLDTDLDAALLSEGLAREVVNRVQGLRREAGFAVSDRIELGLAIDDSALAAAVEEHEEMTLNEVLATRIYAVDDTASEVLQVAGVDVRVEVKRVE